MEVNKILKNKIPPNQQIDPNEPQEEPNEDEVENFNINQEIDKIPLVDIEMNKRKVLEIGVEERED